MHGLPARSSASFASRWLLPALVLAPPASTYALLRAGAPPLLASTGVLLALVVGLSWLERVLPHDRQWNRPRGDAATDRVYLVAATLTDKLTRVAAAALLTGAAAMSAGETGASGLHLLGATALAFLLGDLGKYWAHRLSHERPSLWPIHAVHHGASRLYALNGLRVHPLNVAWNALFDAAPVLLLGLPAWVVAVLGALRGAVSLLQHANVRVEPGLLGAVVNTPNAHRWHHARSLDEADCNYGSTLIVWDRLFGTYRRPELDGQPASLGFEGDRHMPSTFAGQLLYPLCQERLLTSCFSARVREMLR